MDRFSKTKKFYVQKHEDYHIAQQKQLFGKKNWRPKNDQKMTIFDLYDLVEKIAQG